jgi:hypothetical protein
MRIIKYLVITTTCIKVVINRDIREMYSICQNNKSPLLNLFAQFYIHLQYHPNKVIPEQNAGE